MPDWIITAILCPDLLDYSPSDNNRSFHQKAIDSLKSGSGRIRVWFCVGDPGKATANKWFINSSACCAIRDWCIYLDVCLLALWDIWGSFHFLLRPSWPYRRRGDRIASWFWKNKTDSHHWKKDRARQGPLRWRDRFLWHRRIGFWERDFLKW